MLLSIQKPCLLQLILLTLLFTQLNKVKPTNPSSTSHTLTNFTFPNFWSDIPKITFQGGASHSIGALQLTRIGNDCKPMRSDKGQASYSQPVFLWDSIGHEASFYTSFSFIVKNYDVPRVSADGFAFFLAPVNSTVKGYGGCLGLFRFSTAADPSKNQVVAVEFDTWPNYEWSDLSYPHIGIDVNSAVSVATTRWEDSDAYGSKMGTAHISYDATSKILKVRLTYDNGNVYVLSHVVDLKKILPKWVRIGFSAGTGYRQTQFILSWSFTSTIGIAKTSILNQNLSFPS